MSIYNSDRASCEKSPSVSCWPLTEVRERGKINILPARQKSDPARHWWLCIAPFLQAIHLKHRREWLSLGTWLKKPNQTSLLYIVKAIVLNSTIITAVYIHNPLMANYINSLLVFEPVIYIHHPFWLNTESNYTIFTVNYCVLLSWHLYPPPNHS